MLRRAISRKPFFSLTQGLLEGEKYQTLLGVTGSGKTFTIANVIRTGTKTNTGAYA